MAVKTIAARKTIEASDVAVRQVPADDTNLNGVYSDPTKVIGLLAGVNILQGQPIYSNLLASETAGQDYSIIGPGESISPDSPVLAGDRPHRHRRPGGRWDRSGPATTSTSS